jgi:hypothetical protein
MTEASSSPKAESFLDAGHVQIIAVFASLQEAGCSFFQVKIIRSNLRATIPLSLPKLSSSNFLSLLGYAYRWMPLHVVRFSSRLDQERKQNSGSK